MTQLHDTGEEFIVGVTFRDDDLTKPTTVDVGLYNDSIDTLSEENNTGDITTEPSGSNYNRQVADLDSPEFDNEKVSGDWQTTIENQTFNVTDSDQDVDAYFVTVEFDSEDTGTLDDHLFWTGDLDQEYDLNSVDELTLSGAGLRVS